MFSNKKRMGQNPSGYNPFGFNPNQNFQNFQENSMPNFYDIERLKTEINEIKRTQTEMLNRIARMENYLGVRNELSSNPSMKY